MSRDDEGDLEPLTSAPDSEGPDLDSRAAALRRMVAQLVLETTSEGIWLIDAQARTTFVNRHAAHLLGYPEEEMLGKHIFDFMSEARKAIAQQNLMRRQRGAEDRQEVELRRKDGRPIWVMASTNPVYDRNGRYAGALALIGDLSVQKEREERLRSQVDELTARLASKTQHWARSQGPAASPPPSPATSNGASKVRGESVPLVREVIRSASVVATCGAFLGIVGLLTALGVVKGARGGSPVESLNV
jgi:PAS domain S-box-containing protein